VLVNLGANLTGWTLTEATGISDDGQVIVGWGTNPSGDQEAWRAEVPRCYEEFTVAGGPTSFSVLGGSGNIGGLDVTFPDAMAGGTFTASCVLVPQANLPFVVPGGGFGSFALPTDPMLFLDLDFDFGFTPPVEVTIGYDPAAFQPGYSPASLEVQRYVPLFPGCTPGVDCDWITLPVIALDTLANTITVETAGFSMFVLAAPTASVPALGPVSIALTMGALVGVAAYWIRRTR
jgi:hypothetical protein